MTEDKKVTIINAKFKIDLYNMIPQILFFVIMATAMVALFTTSNNPDRSDFIVLGVCGLVAVSCCVGVIASDLRAKHWRQVMSEAAMPEKVGQANRKSESKEES